MIQFFSAFNSYQIWETEAPIVQSHTRGFLGNPPLVRVSVQAPVLTQSFTHSKTLYVDQYVCGLCFRNHQRPRTSGWWNHLKRKFTLSWWPSSNTSITGDIRCVTLHINLPSKADVDRGWGSFTWDDWSLLATRKSSKLVPLWGLLMLGGIRNQNSIGALL